MNSHAARSDIGDSRHVRLGNGRIRITFSNMIPVARGFALVISILQTGVARADGRGLDTVARVKPLVGMPVAAPLEAQAAGPAFGAMRLQVDAAAWAQLDAADIAWMDAVPLSDGSNVDLRMTRVQPFSADARIVQMVPGRNGVAVERELPLPTVSAWRGCVAGHPDSTAVIVRSDAGLHGWIQFDHRTEIISSGNPAGGDEPMIADAAFLQMGSFVCENPPPMNDADALADADAPPIARLTTAACRQLPIAVETDQELLAKFAGNTTTTSAYVATIFAGLMDIYSRDFNGRPSITYLRWWSTTDPWIGTNSSDALTELRTHWNANMTATPRVFTTMLSGRSLGGGIAWLSQACASTSGSGYGYSFCGSLNGSFPYPLVSNSSSNWDIIVTSHEIGHNMSARHTHELGLDDCYLADGSGLGACTMKASGTIMSYCHLCSGGYTNIALNFDSTNIASIISHIGSKSCTQPSVALPVAIADTTAVLEGSTNLLDVLANDSASNCESVSIQGLPATSSLGVPLGINPTGSPSGGPAITYNPGVGIRGTDTFTYTLKDASNQVSVPATVTIDVKPVLAPFSGLANNEPGLNSRFYALTSPTTLPDFSTLTPYQYGTVSLLAYGSTTGICVGSGRADNVGAVFEGWIQAATEGNHTMSITSDAGSQLFIDGELVIDNNGLHTYTEKTGTIYLKPGFHSIRIPFFESSGSCGLTLKWAVPGTTTRVNVPASALSHGGQIHDLDDSGAVDLGDLALLMLDFGSDCSLNPCYGDPNGQQRIGIDSACSCPSDLDGSGSVDFGDVAFFLMY